MSAAVRQLAAQPRNLLLAAALVLPALVLAALLQGGPFAAERSLAPRPVVAPAPVAAAQVTPAVAVAVEEGGFQWSAAATAEEAYAWSGAIRWEDR